MYKNQQIVVPVVLNGNELKFARFQTTLLLLLYFVD